MSIFGFFNRLLRSPKDSTAHEPQKALVPEVKLAVQRPRCPFYGFYAAMGCFLDTGGNGCGIITDSHSPCEMKMRGESPDWKNCLITLEGKKDLSPIFQLAVFPDEFRPAGQESWKGISFGWWTEHILGKGGVKG